MTPGFSHAMAADYSMMSVALTGSNHFAWEQDSVGNKFDYRPNPQPGAPKVTQTCHMRLDQRCAGAETFRANVGLPSELKPNDKIAESIQEMLNIWKSRGTRL